MKPNETLTIGDSWMVEVNGGGDPWPVLCCIPEELRQGVSGTTAADWANDLNGMLTRASYTPASAVVVSLGGNDLRAALKDVHLSGHEVIDGMANLLRVIKATRKGRVVLMQYANVFANHPSLSLVGAGVVYLLNRYLALAAWIAGDVELLRCEDFLTAEDMPPAGADVDIHPTQSGHVKIANKVIELLGVTA